MDWCTSWVSIWYKVKRVICDDLLYVGSNAMLENHEIKNATSNTIYAKKGYNDGKFVFNDTQTWSLLEFCFQMHCKEKPYTDWQTDRCTTQHMQSHNSPLRLG